jgi:hypothetical protein
MSNYYVRAILHLRFNYNGGLPQNRKEGFILENPQCQTQKTLTHTHTHPKRVTKHIHL